jgi:hypothetical protein
MARLLDRELLLGAEAAPFRADDSRAASPGEFRCAVLTTGIDDQNLVAEGEARQAVRKLTGGVLGDQYGGEELAIVRGHGQL